MELFTTNATIRTAIADIKATGTKLDAMIQVAAVSCMAKHNADGNTGLINELVEAMPKGSRVNALRDYLNKYGKIEYNTETKVFDHDKEGTFDKEGAIENQWTDFKPEPKYTAFTIQGLLEDVVKKAHAASKSKAHAGEVDQAIFTQLKALMASNAPLVADSRFGEAPEVEVAV